jgi:hypothetical protein
VEDRGEVEAEGSCRDWVEVTLVGKPGARAKRRCLTGRQVSAVVEAGSNRAAVEVGGGPVEVEWWAAPDPGLAGACARGWLQVDGHGD